MKLNDIAVDIRNVIKDKQLELKLTFEENDHKYCMNGRCDYPSVSRVMKIFYQEFPADEISLSMSKGNLVIQQNLLNEWSKSAEYSANLGSRVHFFLESELVSRYGDYKDVRQPIFECDDEQIKISDLMIDRGRSYLDLMKERECFLIDTEMVLGDPDLGYTGQPDKVWLSYNKDKTNFGIIITDWKTNKSKNFKDTYKNQKMFSPFDMYPNNALGHYYIQLPLYCKLLLNMLKGTAYENIPILGCIVVHLNDELGVKEYRVPSDVINKILSMNISEYLDVI